MSHSLTIGSNRKSISSPAAIESLDSPRFFNLVCNARHRQRRILDSWLHSWHEPRAMDSLAEIPIALEQRTKITNCRAVLAERYA
jgi:hypothetical protein